MHIAVARVRDALALAQKRFTPSPLALGALQTELDNLLAELNATVTPSSLSSAKNAVRGRVMAHPESAIWTLIEDGPYAREREPMAAVALLMARGEAILPAHLTELRRGLEDESRDREEFDRVSKY
jgi:hypothetical protein